LRGDPGWPRDSAGIRFAASVTETRPGYFAFLFLFAGGFFKRLSGRFVVHRSALRRRFAGFGQNGPDLFPKTLLWVFRGNLPNVMQITFVVSNLS
jgi:hypothetical protein